MKLTAAMLALTVAILTTLALIHLATNPPRDPGTRWLHDHASVYYTCTAESRPL